MRGVRVYLLEPRLGAEGMVLVRTHTHLERISHSVHEDAPWPTEEALRASKTHKKVGRRQMRVHHPVIIPVMINSKAHKKVGRRQMRVHHPVIIPVMIHRENGGMGGCGPSRRGMCVCVCVRA